MLASTGWTPERRRSPQAEAVTVDAWTYCSCGHLSAEHAQGGKCRATSLDKWPCECPQLDLYDESRE